MSETTHQSPEAATKKGNKYYGPFFWISVVSFIVPVIVAAKAFEQLVPATNVPTPTPDAKSGVDHEIWDYLMHTYVANGQVDYKGIGRDGLFEEYLSQLASAKLDDLNDDEKLALLINAYNAFVIDGVVSHHITDSVIDYKIEGVGFFDLKEHILANKTYSCNNIEHDWIRKEFNEPRIHVALVCAARSCPSIRGEAFVPERLEAQLADQADLFVTSPKHVRYDAKENTLHLSAILKWYGDDWNKSYPEGGYLAWLLEINENEKLEEGLRKALNDEAKISFNTYDWTLNTQASVSSSGGSKAEFGSGSIPNE